MSDFDKPTNGEPTPPTLTLLRSPALEDYERERLAHVREQLPMLAQRLKDAGVSRVTIQYDGCGDSGCIESMTFIDGDNKPIETLTVPGFDENQIMDLFYDLTQARHSGWENCDGAYGEFQWDLNADTLHHQHNERYTEYDTTEHEGL